MAVPSYAAEVGSRLAEVLSLYPDRKSAASVAGKSVDQLMAYVKGSNAAPFEVIVRLALDKGVNLNWIATGQGEREGGADFVFTNPDGSQTFIECKTTKSGDVSSFRSAQELEDDFVLVPRYDVKAAAGGGAVIHSEQIVDYLAFKTDWVRQTLRINPASLLLIEAMGDSMEDTISDGDLLLVNTAEPRIKDNAIYALSVNGDLIVKRIQRKLDGTLIVKSDNARYDPEEVPPHMTEQLRVIGQVIWHGGLVR